MEDEEAAASDGEIDVDKVKKYTVDDITEGLSKQVNISKTKKSGLDNVTKEIKKPEANSKISILKQKNKRKRTRSQLMFWFQIIYQYSALIKKRV